MLYKEPRGLLLMRGGHEDDVLFSVFCGYHIVNSYLLFNGIVKAGGRLFIVCQVFAAVSQLYKGQFSPTAAHRALAS